MLRGFLDDLLSNRKGWLILAGVSLLWQAVLCVVASDATGGMMTLLAWAPLALVPLWAMWTTGAMIHRRVSSDRAASSPSGWPVLLLQLAAAAIQSIALALVVIGGAWFVFLMTLGVPDLLDILPIPDVGWLTGFVFKGIFLAFLVVPLLCALTQTAYLIGRLVDGYRAALGVWAFVVVAWGSMRILPLLGDALAWLPDIPFQEVFEVGPVFEFRTVYVDTGPFGALVALAIVLAAATGPLLKHVESTRDLSLAEYEAQSLRRAPVRNGR